MAVRMAGRTADEGDELAPLQLSQLHPRPWPNSAAAYHTGGAQDRGHRAEEIRPGHVSPQEHREQGRILREGGQNQADLRSPVEGW